MSGLSIERLQHVLDSTLPAEGPRGPSEDVGEIDVPGTRVPGRSEGVPAGTPSGLEPWLESAADLLDEPDPGPTPFLVSDLIVDRAVAAIQGKPKSWKTWLELELARAIVTGLPALGRFEVPEPGPVIVVLEESGRAALYRRLGALARGNAIRAEQLASLHFASNRRVRLDDPDWQARLLTAAETIQPRAVFLDPLARLKSPGRNENAQDEMAVLLDFMRLLRDRGDCAVVFVHHTGHEGTHLRGSSDLESYWESKVTLTRDGDETDLRSEHREAEASRTYAFRQAWDSETRSLRLRLGEDVRREELRAKVAAELEKNPQASANAVYEELGGNRADVLKAVAYLRDEQVVPSSLVPAGTTNSAKARSGTEPGGSPPEGEPLPVPPDSGGSESAGTAPVGEALDTRERKR